MSISESLGEQRVAGLESGSLSYRDSGDGPPVLFVHGLAVNADLWRNVVPPLVHAGLRCITPDWPMGSHHLPMAPDADLSPPGIAAMIAEFMDVLGLEQVTLVGNDIGGAMCQLVAAQHPNRLGRLVLTSCDSYEVFPPKPFGLFKWIAQVPGGLRLTMNAMQWSAVRNSALAYGRTMNGPPSPEVFDSYTRPAHRSAAIRRDTARTLAGLSNVHTQRAACSFGQFTAPVLIAWAENDRLFPRELAHRLAADFPTSTLEIIQGSRTFIGEDQPEALARAILSFTAAHPPRQPGVVEPPTSTQRQ